MRRPPPRETLRNGPVPEGAAVDPEHALDRIAFLLERAQEPTYRVRAFRSASAVLREHGPDEIRDRIFFPLVSGRQGGSGLGLSLAQTFVQQHGGTIECDSRPGRTTFRVLLPLP